jgi:hypothetical protein
MDINIQNIDIIVNEIKCKMIIHVIQFLHEILDDKYKYFRKWYNEYKLDSIILVYPKYSTKTLKYKGYEHHFNQHYINFIIPELKYDYIFDYENIRYKLKGTTNFTLHILELNYVDWKENMYDMRYSKYLLERSIRKACSMIKFEDIIDVALDYTSHMYKCKNMILQHGVGCIEIIF